MDFDYKKVVFQCFNYLDLSVFDIDKVENIKNLEDCIKYYERETISEFKCEKCEGEIMMKNTIYKLPQILIICFNRVYNNEHFNHLVEYPEYFYSNDYFSEKPKLLYPSNSKEENLYSLNGLIIHFGTANSGHKTSFCKNFFNNNWYFFNDSSRYLIDKNKIFKETFLLIYENKNYLCENIEDIKKVCDNNYTSSNYSIYDYEKNHKKKINKNKNRNNNYNYNNYENFEFLDCL